MEERPILLWAVLGAAIIVTTVAVTLMSLYVSRAGSQKQLRTKRVTLGVRLNGGLGNALFQIAAGMAHALRHGYALQVYKGPDNKTVQYWDNVFAPFKAFRAPDKRPKGMAVYKEPQFSYVPLPEFKRDTCLEGYFQSGNYFREIAGALCADFFRNVPPAPELEDAVTMHVRRGDYVKLDKTFVVQPIEYYRAALEHLKAHYGAQSFKVVVFSNDLEWCKATLPAAMPEHQWGFYEHGEDWEQLGAMTLTRDHVIANSSFSWWGAKGRKSTGGVVIAPKAWFAEKGPQDWQDIYEPDWVTL